MKTTSKNIMQHKTIASKNNDCGTAPGNLVSSQSLLIICIFYAFKKNISFYCHLSTITVRYLQSRHLSVLQHQSSPIRIHFINIIVNCWSSFFILIFFFLKTVAAKVFALQCKIIKDIHTFI
jgi:hypothetical protein